MSQELIYKILLSPIVTEKSSRVAEQNRQVVFKVVKDATKPEIKKAVEKLFDVKVETVRVATIKGKKKRFGGMQGRRKDYKKAYVGLQEGYDIDFAKAE